MLAVGAPVPEATVWLAPREPVNLADLDERMLLLFFVAAWSST